MSVMKPMLDQEEYEKLRLLPLEKMLSFAQRFKLDFNKVSPEDLKNPETLFVAITQENERRTSTEALARALSRLVRLVNLKAPDIILESNKKIVLHRLIDIDVEGLVDVFVNSAEWMKEYENVHRSGN